MSLPQRSPAPVLPRSATYGTRPARPVAPGSHLGMRPAPAHVRPQPGLAPMGQRPMAARPAGPSAAPRPAMERPAPRAAVSFLTVAEVAAIMRVSKMTVYRLVHGGELSAVRVGRSFRVPEPAVREYLSDARTDVA
ncbi:excisionase family DNA-binding protein [Geodermatophilus sp. SYSU D00697]